MKTMVRPSSLAMSLSTALSRSSNSPRNFAPASSEAMSSESTRLFLSVSGTSPLTMRCARPSTIAVLPTPGSPISTGLFFVRRCRIWIARRISSSRPITGSSLPARARSVRSIVYFLSASRLLSPSGLVTGWPPRTAWIAASSALRVRPCWRASLPVSPLSSASASRNISLEMYESPAFCASLSAWLSRPASSRPTCRLPSLPFTCGSRSSASAKPVCNAWTCTPARASSERAAPSDCASSADSACGPSMYWWSRPAARLWASCSASWNFVVSLSILMNPSDSAMQSK